MKIQIKTLMEFKNLKIGDYFFDDACSLMRKTKTDENQTNSELIWDYWSGETGGLFRIEPGETVVKISSPKNKIEFEIV